MEIAPGYRGPFTPSVKFNYKTVNGLINRVLSLAGGKGGGEYEAAGGRDGGGGTKAISKSCSREPFSFLQPIPRKNVCRMFVLFLFASTRGIHGRQYIFVSRENLFV